MAPTRSDPPAPVRRRPLPFKPPRPVASGASAVAGPTSKSRTASVPGSKGLKTSSTTHKVSKTSSRPQRPVVLISDDDDEDSGEDSSRSESDETDDETTMRDVQTTKPRRASREAQSIQRTTKLPSIPEKLLARLLYDSFKDKSTRVGKDALVVFSKYIEIFTREALARAAFERDEIERDMGGLGDGFLQVEDLERLAPQLMLDF